MKYFTLFMLIISLHLQVSAQDLSGEEALKRLMEGNTRFSSGSLNNPDRSLDRVVELINGQNPYAIILSCSDSRVPPEVIFDEGLGDLFVIRLAGNIADESSVGSIEYAAEHLGTPLVMVLGHEKCGAVTAALEPHDYGVNINFIINKISPAVKKAESEAGDRLKNAVVENVKTVINTLNQSEILKHLQHDGKFKIVPAYYNLSTGIVEIIN